MAKLTEPAGKRYATSTIRPKSVVMESFSDPLEILGLLTKMTVMGLLNATENFDETVSIEIKPYKLPDGEAAYRIDAEQTIPDEKDVNKELELFDTYRGAILQATVNGARYILLDKNFMIQTFGSIYESLTFFHKIFVEVSRERRSKFYIRTDFHDPSKFRVVWLREGLVSSVQTRREASAER
jgi:hypothetical protein